MYHIGAQAIAARLGYKSRRMVDTLIRREGLPVYKRSHQPRPNVCWKVLAISEEALVMWELAKGARHVARRRARAAEKEEGRMLALARQKRDVA